MITVLVRLLAQQQLMYEHAEGIHIALHAQSAPIKCLRWLKMLHPASRSIVFVLLFPVWVSKSQKCNAYSDIYRSYDTCHANCMTGAHSTCLSCAIELAVHETFMELARVPAIRVIIASHVIQLEVCSTVAVQQHLQHNATLR